MSSRVRDLSDCDVALEVVQGPQRARMCGFGDKDRRPITPPPCVRLIITNRQTGASVDPSNLEAGFFILSVELWQVDMITETNLVAQPSSSSAGAARERDRQVDTAVATTSVPAPAPTSTQGQQTAPTDSAGVSAGTTAGSRSQTRIQLPPISQIGDLPRQSASTAAPTQAADDLPRPSMTRNLIGALVASAYKLRDTQNELGVWFILSDLSVRTEGTFRLKFSFFNLTADQKNLLDVDSTPVQCTVFSDPFTVYSAKRFPGMIESSDLSRKFAAQGIKLPVRNETRKA